jgi:hypothetical protein
MGSRAITDGGGGAPSLFGVNPDDLDTAAKAAHDTGAAMVGEVKTIQQPSDDAVAGLLGWRTAGSLSACTSAWEDTLRKLGTEVDGVGDKLNATATNYRNGDISVRERLPGPYGPNLGVN